MQFVIKKIIKYQNRVNINKDGLNEVYLLLNHLNNETEELNKINIRYLEQIQNIYLNLAIIQDDLNAPFKALEIVKIYLERQLKSKSEFHEDILKAAIVLLRNSIKSYIFNLDDTVFYSALDFINRMDNMIKENRDVRNYLTCINEKKFEIELSFILPFPLYLDNKHIYKKKFNDLIYKMRFYLINNKNDFINAKEINHIILNDDKYGLLNKTKVIFNFITQIENSNNSHEYYSKYVKQCCDVLNDFIIYFRLINDNYWVEKINDHMINGYSYKLEYNNEELLVNHYAQYNDRYYKITNDINTFIDNDLYKLLENRISKGIKLWELLLADSKAYLDIDKNREAIIAINSAFENYIETDLKNFFSQLIDTDKVQQIYNGSIEYDAWKFKNEYTYEEFNEFKRIQLIRDEKPVINRLIKNLINESNYDKISKTKANKLIDKIRKKRNDLIHGRIDTSTDKQLKGIAKDAIEAFMKFTDLFS